jgi:hypothetical protein
MICCEVYNTLIHELPFNELIGYHFQLIYFKGIIVQQYPVVYFNAIQQYQTTGVFRSLNKVTNSVVQEIAFTGNCLY